MLYLFIYFFNVKFFERTRGVFMMHGSFTKHIFLYYQLLKQHLPTRFVSKHTHTHIHTPHTCAHTYEQPSLFLFFFFLEKRHATVLLLSLLSITHHVHTTHVHITHSTLLLHHLLLSHHHHLLLLSHHHHLLLLR